MKTETITGFYGGSHTPCNVFIYWDSWDQLHWYCVEGSVNVNATGLQEMTDGVDVEMIGDCDTFTASSPINSEQELEDACNDYIKNEYTGATQ
jgi:hypothetical protein|tara:strand:+ start:565 stop:843 length:279 start_codon:yes stop_codon:yes gene_type:complete